MIVKIQRLVQSLHANKALHLNNSLPVLLKILSKENQNLYTIKIGNILRQTKSLRNLQVGMRYFAAISYSSIGTTLISDLFLYPKEIWKIQEIALPLNLIDIKHILKNTQNKNEWKQLLIQQFANADNRDLFWFYGNLLLALRENIYIFLLEEKSKKTILQISPKDSSIEFFAIFPNLGPLEGRVYEDMKKEWSLEIYTHFNSVKNLLFNHKKSLKGFKKIEVFIQKNPSPMFNFSQHLLNTLA